MEGKLDPSTNPLELETDEHGQPRWRGSGKDLSYRDDLTGEKYVPHVIEPSAGADRATLAFLCEAYTEDEAPDDSGTMKSRTVMRLHPRLAPAIGQAAVALGARLVVAAPPTIGGAQAPSTQSSSPGH